MDPKNPTPKTGPRPQRNGLYIVWYSPRGFATIGTYYTCTEDQIAVVEAINERAKILKGGTAKLVDAEASARHLSAVPLTRHPWYDDFEYLTEDEGF